MSMKKNVITGLIVAGLVSTSALPTYAATGNNSLSSNHENELPNGAIDINNPDQRTVISEVLTFEEIVDQISDEQGITEEEAASQVITGTSTSTPTSKKSLRNSQNLSGITSSSQAVTTAATATYRTITKTFTVKSEYKPSLKFYCQTNEGGTSFRSIKKILNVGMNRKTYGGTLTKGFDGSVYAHLQSPNRIFWIVNGDFYNNNTVTTNGAVNIGLNQAASVDFGVSSTTSHYKYIYLDGYAYF